MCFITIICHYIIPAQVRAAQCSALHPVKDVSIGWSKCVNKEAKCPEKKRIRSQTHVLRALRCFSFLTFLRDFLFTSCCKHISKPYSVLKPSFPLSAASLTSALTHFLSFWVCWWSELMGSAWLWEWEKGVLSNWRGAFLLLLLLKHC